MNNDIQKNQNYCQKELIGLIYHGPEHWECSKHLSELYKGNDLYKEFLPDFNFLVINLGLDHRFVHNVGANLMFALRTKTKNEPISKKQCI